MSYYQAFVSFKEKGLVGSEQSSFFKNFFLDIEGCFYSGRREDDREKYASKLELVNSMLQNIFQLSLACSSVQSTAKQVH